MKTLILNGSPRKNGDTASLLARLQTKLPGEIKCIDAYTANIAPCIDCRYCRMHEGCAVLDDMQEMYSYLKECDNILIASPIYFSELTGKLLDIASRLQVYYNACVFQKKPMPLKPKKGAVLLLGGGSGKAEKAYDTARLLLRQMNCTAIYPAVGSYNTDQLPAIEDKTCLRGIDGIVQFFN